MYIIYVYIHEEKGWPPQIGTTKRWEAIPTESNSYGGVNRNGAPVAMKSHYLKVDKSAPINELRRSLQ